MRAGRKLCVGRTLLDGRLDWRTCDNAEIERSEAAGGVLIQPSFPLREGDGNTSLFLDDRSFQISGVHAFTGYIRIGDGVQSGRSTQLLLGDYTFYERDALSRLLRRWNPDEGLKGSFRHGDQVSIVRRAGLFERFKGFLARRNLLRDADNSANEQSCPDSATEALAPGSVGQEVMGHLGPSDPEKRESLLVTATSSSGNVSLNVLRRGLAEPLTLRRDWIDVVIASPAFLALTLVFTCLASIHQAVVPSSKSSKPQDDV